MGKVKGIDLGGMRVAGRGMRNRGHRREEVEVKPWRRSLGLDVSNLVLETVEESCAFREESLGMHRLLEFVRRVLVGLR